LLSIFSTTVEPEKYCIYAFYTRLGLLSF